MFEKILSFDKKLLIGINSNHSLFLDDFFYIFSGQKIWFLMALVIVLIIIRNYKKDSLIVFFAIFLVILISDQLSSTLIKPLVCRLRPTQQPSLGNVLHIVHDYRSGGFSFVSSHAANAFAFATLSSVIFRNKIYSFTIFTWAILTAFSRIYLGVHYPIDVFCGSIIGVLSALFIFFIFKKIRPICFETILKKREALIIMITFLLTLCATSIFHSQLIILG